MAAVSRLSQSVVVTLVEPAAGQPAGHQLSIDRVSATCSMFGVQGSREFIKPIVVAPEDRRKVVRLHQASAS
jgi:hypothetical protein